MIDYLEIEGYKSIKELKIELKPINILIGSNGAGKSNFISFFKLLKSIFNGQMQRFVLEEGKADGLLYFGTKSTSELRGSIHITQVEGKGDGYGFVLNPSKEGNLFFSLEGVGANRHPYRMPESATIDLSFNEESVVASGNYNSALFVREFFKKIYVFHFHDTSSKSSLRKSCDVEDNLFLKSDGANLPAYLYYLKIKHPIIYKRIVFTVRSVAPFLDSFILEPSRINDDKIELRWTEADDPDSNFGASQFSDGTIRFIALTTLLLQPEPPEVIIIDEPELGLHPLAISKLAGMIEICSQKAQIIISTQSVNLVDQFGAEDIITVDRSTEEKQSIFRRLKREELAVWLEGHTMGDLWERNIIDAAQPFKK